MDSDQVQNLVCRNLVTARFVVWEAWFEIRSRLQLLNSPLESVEGFVYRRCQACLIEIYTFNIEWSWIQKAKL